MLYIAVLTLHFLVCFFLIIVVLLQSGKAADLAGAFGGMGSQTAFGPRGSATLLSKATTISAVLFMFTSLTLSILATRNAGLTSTVLEGSPTSVPAKSSPAAPAQRPAPGQTVPITVTPEGGQPMTIQAPVLPSPPPGAKQQPAPAPAPAPKK